MRKILHLVGAAAILSIPIAAQAQYQAGVGIESASSNDISRLTIGRIIYQGECPGTRQFPEKGYFVSDERPPSPGQRVKLTNMSRGLSPDNPPYTDRSYAKGRASESFEIALGSGHQGRYFIVRPGTNLMQFEITRDGNTLESGTFPFHVDVSESTEIRNKTLEEVTKYTSDGKPYKTTEYRCP
jgi:hypothetical protein